MIRRYTAVFQVALGSDCCRLCYAFVTQILLLSLYFTLSAITEIPPTGSEFCRLLFCGCLT